MGRAPGLWLGGVGEVQVSTEVLGRRHRSSPKGYTSAPCPHSLPLNLLAYVSPSWSPLVPTLLTLSLPAPTTSALLSQSEG